MEKWAILSIAMSFTYGTSQLAKCLHLHPQYLLLLLLVTAQMCSLLHEVQTRVRTCVCALLSRKAPAVSGHHVLAVIKVLSSAE